MRDLLLFPSWSNHAADDDRAGFRWICVDPRGGKSKTGMSGGDAKKSNPPAADRVILLAPGELVAAHDVELPARTDAQARAAAGYAVEDLTAQPLDEVIVAAGPAREQGSRRTVAVVDRDVFAGWRAALAGQGLAPDLIVPDYMALPCAPDGASLADLGDRVLVRLGAAGFAIEADIAGEVIAAYLAQANVRSVRAWTDRLDVLLSASAQAGRTIEVEPPLTEETFAQLLHEGLQSPPDVDLARADAPPSDVLMVVWRRWRTGVVLGFVAAFAYAALLMFQTASYDRARDDAYAEAEQAIRGAFPEITRVVNPRAQLRSRLGEAQADGAAFVALSGLIADSMRDIETIEVDAVRYDAARDALDVAIRYAAYDDVERLGAAVSARGGVMEEGGSRRVGDAMVSDISVRAGS